MDEAGASAVADPDPLRAHFLQALARRAATRQGAEQALLQARLAALQALPDATEPAPAPAVPPRPAATPGPLAALLQGLRPPVAVAGPRAAAVAEPDMLQFFRSTWARLDAERRLNASLDQAPDNPGPLNSEHLVHQALQLMRSAAPDYLRHFMAEIDALVWLEDALADSAAAAKPAPGAKTAKATKTASKTAAKSASTGKTATKGTAARKSARGAGTGKRA